MIPYEFVFSDHANKRFNQRFPGLVLSNEIKTLTPCKAKDLSFISGTLSYRRIKKSERHKYRFLVSDSGAYFICKTMGVIGGVEHLKVITVLKDEDKGFHQEMLDYALELYRKEQKIEQKKEAASEITVNQSAKSLNEDPKPVLTEEEKKELDRLRNQQKREEDYHEAISYLIAKPRLLFIKEIKEDVIDQNINRHCTVVGMLASLYRSYLNLKERMKAFEIEDGDIKQFKKRELSSIAQKLEKAFIIRAMVIHECVETEWYELIDEIVSDYIDMALTILDNVYGTSKISVKNRDSVISIFSAITKAEGVSFVDNAKLRAIFSYLVSYEQFEMTEIYKGQSFTAKELAGRVFQISYLSKLSFVDDELKQKLHSITSFYDVVLDRVSDLEIDDMLKISVADLTPNTKVDVEIDDTETEENDEIASNC